MRVYYVGPDSVVWHKTDLCPRLKSSHRYWPVNHVVGKEAEKIMAERRPCKECAVISERELEALAARSKGSPMVPRSKRPAGGGTITRGS